MNIMKKIFVQSMVISTSILLLNGINAVIQHFAGNDMILLWYHPISIVLAGSLCSLPTFLLRDMESWSRKTFAVRVILHCLSLYAVIVGMGYLFGWFTGLDGLAGVSFVFFVTYAFVWLSSHWLDQRDAKMINHALDSIRDRE